MALQLSGEGRLGVSRFVYREGRCDGLLKYCPARAREVVTVACSCDLVVKFRREG
jgi:hypothetical protein